MHSLARPRERYYHAAARQFALEQGSRLKWRRSSAPVGGVPDVPSPAPSPLDGGGGNRRLEDGARINLPQCQRIHVSYCRHGAERGKD